LSVNAQSGIYRGWYGAGLRHGTAYLVGASQQNIYLSGIVVAAIIVFGLMGKKY